MYNFDNDLIYFVRREGNSENPYIDIQEDIYVEYDKVFLKEIPSRAFKVIVERDGENLVEVHRRDDVINGGLYYVDYLQGIVYFHNTVNGNPVRLSYRGIGILLYPASRIYVDGENKDIPLTLREIVKESMEAIKLIDESKEVLEGVVETMTEVDSKIEEMNVLIIDGNNAIQLLNQKNIEFQERIDVIDQLLQDKIEEINNTLTDEINSKIVDLENTINQESENLRNILNQNISEWGEQYAQVISDIENAENLRVISENNRNENEEDRTASELIRVQNESSREQQESLRESNESSRQDNETIRENSEAIRVQQEHNRQQQFQENLATIEEKIDETNQIINSANDKFNDVDELIDNTKFINTYSSTVLYNKNNIVNHNGSSYIAKQETIGNNPPIDSVENDYWALLARRGMDGEGSVSSVNSVPPNSDGNVQLTADDINTYTKLEIDVKISDVIDSSPESLNTLNKIAKAIDEDPNFSTNISTEIDGKVDKIDGKQLSTEDYTTEEKTKLSSIENNANNYVHPSSHPAEMIVEDETRRFVTDEQISDFHNHENKDVLDRFSDLDGKPHYNGQPIGGEVPNLTETMLTLGKFKIQYNEEEDCLDIVVIT